MEGQSGAGSNGKVDLSKFSTLVKVQNAIFQEFKPDNKRQLIDICPCQILQKVSQEGTDLPQQFIRLGSFLQRMDDTTYARANFQNLTTYIFQNRQNENSIYLVSIEVYNPDAQQFNHTISEATHVVEYKSDSFEKTSLNQKIQTICGGEITQETVESVGALNPILKTMGSILGSVSKNVSQPSSKAQDLWRNSMQMMSQKYVSDENRGRWNVVKQKASNVNEKMTQMYKPIDNAFKMIANVVGQNFNNSQNTFLKSLKKFGKVTAKTLNNSYKKAQSSFGVRSEQNNQNKPNPSMEMHQQSNVNLTS